MSQQRLNILGNILMKITLYFCFCEGIIRICDNIWSDSHGYILYLWYFAFITLDHERNQWWLKLLNWDIFVKQLQIRNQVEESLSRDLFTLCDLLYLRPNAQKECILIKYIISLHSLYQNFKHPWTNIIVPSQIQNCREYPFSQ